MKDTVVPYKRYSDPTQGKGSSEQRQDEGAAEFIAHIRGVEWDDPQGGYCDRGKSGYSETEGHTKHDFGRLLADCDRKLFPPNSIIYFEDMDRFGRRKVAPTLTDWQRILTAGYRIGVDGKVYDTDTPEMELMTVILKAILGREESEKKSKRGKKNWAMKRERADGLTKEKAKSAACPSWLSVVNGQYQFNENAATLKNVCELALTRGVGQLSQELDIEQGGLGKLLRSRTLMGEYQAYIRPTKSTRKPVGDPVPNYYPALLTEAQFTKLQAALDSRKNKAGRRGTDGQDTSLFTHLVFDAADDMPMTIKGLSRNGQKVLQAQVKRGHKYVDYNFCETALLSMLSELHSSSLTAAPTADPELERLEVQAARLKGRIAAIRSEMVFSDKSVSELRETLNVASEALEGVKEAIETRKRENTKPTSSEAITGLTSVLRAMRNATGSDLTDIRTRLKRQLLPALVKKISCRVIGTFDVSFTVEMTHATKSFHATQKPDGVHVTTENTGDLLAALRADGQEDAAKDIEAVGKALAG
jgi:DNA invertase Pin-like site-specific DNA recombinase